MNGDISKDDLKKALIERSIFDGTVTPAKLSLFRYSIIKIEKLMNEIVTKQAFRHGMSVPEFIAECQSDELIETPF